MSYWNIQPDGEPVIFRKARIAAPPHHQDQHNDRDEEMCEAILSAAVADAWKSTISSNIGMKKLAITRITKTNEWTMLRNMTFHSFETNPENVEYLLTTMPLGKHYLTGRLNTARSSNSLDEEEKISPAESHFSALIIKTSATSGVIRTLTRMKEGLQPVDRTLTKNNMFFYFSDLYRSYYLAEDFVDSSRTKEVRALLSRGKWEEKQTKHIAKQAAKREAQTQAPAQEQTASQGPPRKRRKRGYKCDDD